LPDFKRELKLESKATFYAMFFRPEASSFQYVLCPSKDNVYWFLFAVVENRLNAYGDSLVFLLTASPANPSLSSFLVPEATLQLGHKHCHPIMHYADNGSYFDDCLDLFSEIVILSKTIKQKFYTRGDYIFFHPVTAELPLNKFAYLAKKQAELVEIFKHLINELKIAADNVNFFPVFFSSFNKPLQEKIQSLEITLQQMTNMEVKSIEDIKENILSPLLGEILTLQKIFVNGNEKKLQKLLYKIQEDLFKIAKHLVVGFPKADSISMFYTI